MGIWPAGVSVGVTGPLEWTGGACRVRLQSGGLALLTAEEARAVAAELVRRAEGVEGGAGAGKGSSLYGLQPDERSLIEAVLAYREVHGFEVSSAGDALYEAIAVYVKGRREESSDVSTWRKRGTVLRSKCLHDKGTRYVITIPDAVVYQAEHGEAPQDAMSAAGVPYNFEVVNGSAEGAKETQGCPQEGSQAERGVATWMCDECVVVMGVRSTNCCRCGRPANENRAREKGEASLSQEVSVADLADYRKDRLVWQEILSDLRERGFDVVRKRMREERADPLDDDESAEHEGAMQALERAGFTESPTPEASTVDEIDVRMRCLDDVCWFLTDAGFQDAAKALYDSPARQEMTLGRWSR